MLCYVVRLPPWRSIMARAQAWNPSVWVPQGKHKQSASDAALSNTLTARDSINAADFRKTRSTHVPTQRLNLSPLVRSLPPLSAAGQQTPWCASTSFDRRDVLAGAEALTVASVTATRKATRRILGQDAASTLTGSKGGASCSKYMGPIDRVNLVGQKRREAVDAAERQSAELVAKYGLEGAEVGVGCD
jgi:hypothetical protein